MKLFAVWHEHQSIGNPIRKLYFIRGNTEQDLGIPPLPPHENKYKIKEIPLTTLAGSFAIAGAADRHLSNIAAVLKWKDYGDHPEGYTLTVDVLAALANEKDARRVAKAFVSSTPAARFTAKPIEGHPGIHGYKTMRGQLEVWFSAVNFPVCSSFTEAQQQERKAHTKFIAEQEEKEKRTQRWKRLFSWAIPEDGPEPL